MSVQVTSDGTTFARSTPQPLFEARTVGSGFTYDVSSDGERFLMNTEVGESTSSPIIVMVNWTAELER
jgi:hypothetical protein